MDLKIIFGNNLKFYRFKKKYTQAILAEKSNISTNYLSEIERGKHSVDFEIIQKLANTLEINASQLFLPNNSTELPRRIDMNK